MVLPVDEAACRTREIEFECSAPQRDAQRIRLPQPSGDRAPNLVGREAELLAQRFDDGFAPFAMPLEGIRAPLAARAPDVEGTHRRNVQSDEAALRPLLRNGMPRS
jgi:hypothetical protein